MSTRNGFKKALAGKSVLLLALAGFAGFAQAAGYSMTLISGDGTGGFHAALAINDLGQAVGYAGEGYQRTAFLYSNGQRTLLGDPDHDSMAMAINNKGQIVGYTEPVSAPYAARFDASGPTLLGVPGQMSYARGINENGLVVGHVYGSPYATAPSGVDSGFVTHYAGGASAIFNDGGVVSGMALTVNNSGVAAGWSSTQTTGQHVATLFYGDGTVMSIGTFGGNYGEALAINDNGAFAGYNENEYGVRQAFFYGANGVVNLAQAAGFYNSVAFGMNNAGDVVGFGASFSAGTGGFIFHDGQARMLDSLIDEPEWTITEAYDINNRGEIVGIGMNRFTGAHAAVLLTPVSEPETLLLMLGGLAVVLRRARGNSGKEI